MSRLYGGELKHCTFGCDFTKHAQDFGTKFHIVSNKHCDQQCGENTEQQDNRNCDFAAGGAQHHVH